jgi:hypothetical protein
MMHAIPAPTEFIGYRIRIRLWINLMKRLWGGIEKSNFKAHRIISIHVIYPVCMVADLR